MSGRFSSELQSAILYPPGHEPHLGGILPGICSWLEENGVPCNVAEQTPHYVHLIGPREINIRIEVIESQADARVFTESLGSPFVRMAVPDAEQRIAAHGAHVLVWVSHGLLAGSLNGELAAHIERLGLLNAYRNMEDYVFRNRLLGHLTRALAPRERASLIHWCPSNMLFVPERFPEEFEVPEPPFVHPRLYGGDTVAGFGEVTAGIVTLGAEDLIGREIVVVPAPVPWSVQAENALVFLRVATMENGYIVPDDNTFGPEDGSFSCRVRHFEANVPGAIIEQAHYRLTLERHDGYGWTSPDYAPPVPVEGGVAALQAALDTNDPDEREALDRLMRAERAALAAGNGFAVSRRTDGPEAFATPAGKSPMPVSAEPDPAAIDAYEADRPLDPNDPIDRAILERLRERERQGEPEPTPSAEARPAPVVNRARAAFGRRKGGFATRH